VRKTVEATTNEDAASEQGSVGQPLTRFVPLETLHKLQDRFAGLGQVTVCLCDPSCNLVTPPTWGSRYSELIGTSQKGEAEFRDALCACCCCADRATPVSCLEGMALYAARIESDGLHLGYIVVGVRAAAAPPAPQVRMIATAYGVEPETLVEAGLPISAWTGGTPEAIHRHADVLADTIATIYTQADRITRQLADLRIVYGLAELVAGTSDLQKILDLTVQRVVEVMNVKACGIRLLKEETGELVIAAVYNLSKEYQGKGAVTLQNNVIDAAAFAGEVVYIEDARTDPRIRYPENARKEGIVSGLCVPMTYHGKTIGVMRVYTSEVVVFSEDKQRLCRSIASQTASAIINSRLRESQRDAERVRRQMDAAGQIQRRMLPTRPPGHPVLSFGCVYDPSLELGGDFYDFSKLPDGRIGLSIADVVGKGLPAALLMASIRSSLRAHAVADGNIAATVAKVNKDMCRDTLPSEFATLVFGSFSPDGRSFAYTNAGHPRPLLLRGDSFIELDEGGTIIGVISSATFDEGVVSFVSGDTLVLFTDGVTEAMDYHGQMYGVDRLRASILKHRDLDAQHLAHQIHWDVRRFVGFAEQTDDITIVTIKVEC